MQFDTVATNAFFPVWKKYRPVLLKLMKDAEEETQTYPFSKHEFTDVDTKKSTTYPFKLEAHEGRAVNSIKSSLLAQDLLSLLKMSQTAVELMDAATYTFKLDKEFVLHVSSEKAENAEEATEE
ncbi:hypothetical protein [Roseivirga pacifica]|jgi:hypothetical protein|uniref:hypothetical protein n=1 Tax=Roseivirga pacifica TaxID=1267423 RepID=UPI002094F165|nr:hypothetical protein [Roseivirga pacifica]MCO6360517.1 hypothetical protein [Roseivirga pacifica]MCO6368406.1 hypothetical protein [Roseivirga pacifica]MCO6372548.1 hypothetical protein [Roseivirga pacifica]MCO6376606.1 hypothetical protein [Roseivirga pacifica]MCO6378114.1 hypothetical protein [Roseivirga pacifica]